MISSLVESCEKWVGSSLSISRPWVIIEFYVRLITIIPSDFLNPIHINMCHMFSIISINYNSLFQAAVAMTMGSPNVAKSKSSFETHVVRQKCKLNVFPHWLVEMHFIYHSTSTQSLRLWEFVNVRQICSSSMGGFSFLSCIPDCSPLMPQAALGSFVNWNHFSFAVWKWRLEREKLNKARLPPEYHYPVNNTLQKTL